MDRAIDAVGIDATCACSGPAAKLQKPQRRMFKKERATVAPKQRPHGDNWRVGEAPSQVLFWAVDALAKAGTLSIVGVYGPSSNHFPIGKAMNKNLTLNMGNCNHKKYIPELIKRVRAKELVPSRVISQHASFSNAIAAYEQFDKRSPGWTKVELKMAA